jgi:hypothetical protein
MTTGLAILFLVGPVVLVPIWMAGLARPRTAAADRLLRLARWLSLPTGVALAAAFALPPGPLAGLLAVGWLAMASLGAIAAAVDVTAALRGGTWRRPDPNHAWWVAMPFLAVSAGNAVADRLGVQPFGFAPTIILLTAIHFTFAGFILILAGAAAYRSRPSRWLEAAIGSVIVGIPVTAVGFFGVAIAAWIGALLVAAGGFGIGIGHLAAATRGDVVPSVVARSLIGIAGLALLVSMPLAAIYATSVWTGAAWLDLPTMARTHGAINVLAFALPSTVGWAVARRGAR